MNLNQIYQDSIKIGRFLGTLEVTSTAKIGKTNVNQNCANWHKMKRHIEREKEAHQVIYKKLILLHFPQHHLDC